MTDQEKFLESRLELIESKIDLLMAICAFILALGSLLLFVTAAVYGTRLALSTTKPFGTTAATIAPAILSGICYQLTKVLCGISSTHQSGWTVADTILLAGAIICALMTSIDNTLGMAGTYGMVILDAIIGYRVPMIIRKKK